MFDFLFRRSKKSAAAAAPAKPLAAAAPAAPDQAREQARLAAVNQAGALLHEQAALQFLLSCEFPEARLKAAERLQSKPVLEQAFKAMRNTDRRVSKLLRERLEALAKTEVLEQKALACLRQAEQLASQPDCHLSDVVLLDRSWDELGKAEISCRSAFEQARGRIAGRLAAQASLQRAVIDTVAALRALPEDGDAGEADALERQATALAASAEAPSLPKFLVQELHGELERLRQGRLARQEQQAALQARADAVAAWEAQAPAELERQQLVSAWRALPQARGEAARELQSRFEILLGAVAGAKAPAPAPVAVLEQAPAESAVPESPAPEAERPARPSRNKAAPADPQALVAFDAALEAFEQALEQGSLATAAEQDKLLRGEALAGLRPPASQATRLANARRELARLQSWARWGGNVSREELIEAAEALPAKALPVNELADQVAALRGAWRRLDGASGSAPKALWERFDTACNAAYAPAAEQFKLQAEERRRNRDALQALVEEARAFVAQAGLGEPGEQAQDCKALAQFSQRIGQAWQRVGHADRKEKKRLDAELAEALAPLRAVLEGERQREIERRSAIIAQVEQLDPHGAHAVDTIRNLQQRWQQQAKALPLERGDEQSLWERFRAACDGVFERRRQAQQVQDGERQANQAAKAAVCERLEAAGKDELGADKIERLLADSSAEWQGIGAPPRGSEAELEGRYRQAVNALKARRQQLRRSAEREQLQVLEQKLALCRQAEEALQQGGSGADLKAAWDTLPALGARREGPMRRRFDAALAALQDADASYLAQLERNREALRQALLRLEIVLGLESPPELAADRLRMQVGVLQSALAGGQKSAPQEEDLLHLCSLPALSDARDTDRLSRLLEKMGEAA